MRRFQEGFTLIELMMVGMILGLLMVTALPAYQDYTRRAKVVEGIAMGGAAKTAVRENAANGVRYSTGWISPAAGLNVKSIAIADASGIITVTFGAAVEEDATLLLVPYTAPGGAVSALPDSSSTYSVPEEIILWQCAAAGTAVATGVMPGTLAAKWTPATCR